MIAHSVRITFRTGIQHIVFNMPSVLEVRPVETIGSDIALQVAHSE